MTNIKKLKINHKDSRGQIMDIFEKKKINHCTIVTFNKKSIRGNHYHKKSHNRLKSKKSSYNCKTLKGNCFLCGEEGVDIHHLSPQEFADVNNYIGSFHKNHEANLANVCKPCHEDITKNGIIHRKTKTTEGFMYLEQ